MHNILGISGKMGSGKDTLADLLVETSHGTWVKDSFARPVKEELLHMYHTVATQQENTSIHDIATHIAETMSVTPQEAEKMVHLIQFDLLEHKQTLDALQKTPVYRTIMQTWATGIRRAQNPQYWVEQALQNIQTHFNNGQSVVFADVRFDNEAEALLHADGTVIRLHVPYHVQLQRLITRDGVPPSDDSLRHSSETSLDYFQHFSHVFNTADDSPEDILQQLHLHV